eukprot:scaffold5458_cov131-Isochrysis_galbana.AAC.4
MGGALRAGDADAHFEGRLVILVDGHPHDERRHNQVGSGERIVLAIVGVFVRGAKLHHADDRDGGGNENDLHDRVVDAQEVPENVQVAKREDDHI